MSMMTSQILKSVDFTRTKAQKAQAQRSRYLENKIFFFKLKKWVLLNHAPTSLMSFQPPTSSFQPPPSSLEHPERY